MWKKSEEFCYRLTQVVWRANPNSVGGTDICGQSWQLKLS